MGRKGGSILCVSGLCVSTLHAFVISFSPHNHSVKWVLSLCPFYRERERTQGHITSKDEGEEGGREGWKAGDTDGGWMDGRMKGRMEEEHTWSIYKVPHLLLYEFSCVSSCNCQNNHTQCYYYPHFTEKKTEIQRGCLFYQSRGTGSEVP